MNNSSRPLPYMAIRRHWVLGNYLHLPMPLFAHGVLRALHHVIHKAAPGGAGGQGEPSLHHKSDSEPFYPTLSTLNEQL